MLDGEWRSAPESSKAAIVEACPSMQAHMSAVLPSRSTAFTCVS